MGMSSISTTDTQYLHIPAVLESLAQSDDPMAAQVAGWLHYIQFMGGTVGVKGISEENGQLALSFSVSGLSVPMSETDEWYEGVVGDKHGFGINGMTDARRAMIGNSLMNTIASGGVSEWIDGNSLQTIEGMSNVWTNLPQVMELAAILEDNGITNIMDLPTMDKTSDEYKKIDHILRGAGYSADFAAEAVANLNEEAFYEGLRATNAYGDATEDVIQLMQQLQDGAEGAAQAFLNLASAMNDLQDVQRMMQQYLAGSRDPQLISDIQSITGLRPDQIYSNPQLTMEALALAEAKHKDDFASQADAYDAIVSKLNLAPRETAYSMTEVMAQAKIDLANGRITQDDYNSLLLWNHYTADAGYVPSYTVTSNNSGQSTASPSYNNVSEKPIFNFGDM